MSLSEDLRQELARIAPDADCDRLAELGGLFHTAGSVHFRGRGELSLHLDLASSAVARRAFQLLRAFRAESELRSYRRRGFDRSSRYQLHVPGEARALQVLHEAGVLTARLVPLELPPRRLVARSCCRGAFLRGALLGSGSLSGPRAPHIEIRTATLESARFVAGVAAAEGARLATVERGGHAAAYAKGSDTIETLLAAAGASNAVLQLEERAVLAATRAHANRQANADHANLVRMSRAAHAQLRAIKRLSAEGVLATLPDPLQEIAEARVKHPTASLAELAATVATTKPSVHRRLTKLVKLAEL